MGNGVVRRGAVVVCRRRLAAAHEPGKWSSVAIATVGFFALLICGYGLTNVLGARRREAGVLARKRDVFDPEMRHLLDGGDVNVRRVEARDVWVIDDDEEGVMGYLFELHDGRVLFLGGQDYVPVDESMAWPSSVFELVRSSRSGMWVGLFCYGDVLNPSRVVSSAEIRTEVLGEYELILEGGLDRALESLMQSARASACASGGVVQPLRG